MCSHQLNAINTGMKLIKIRLSMAATVILSSALTNNVHADTIQTFPILEKLQSQGRPLAQETIKWMNRWRGVNLDDPSFIMNTLSGGTSVYLKIQKPDSTTADGYKAYGIFGSSNGSNNPYSELAYFNLAAILGYDYIFRPNVRYSLGPRGSQAFKSLLEKADITEELRLKNKIRVLQDITSGKPLKGSIKAHKLSSNIAYNDIADRQAFPNGLPKISNPIITALQATHTQPSPYKQLELIKGYKNNSLQFAREYSVIMTLDVIFQQWDRYSGDNVVLAKDKAGAAHFYSTDNGGATLEKDPSQVLLNLKQFNRYDRKTIYQLKLLYNFLINPARGFLGYKNAEAFVVDLGLYDDLKPSEYVAILKRNLRLLLNQVAKVERQVNNDAYLP